jgi:hypothetical protein
MAPQDLRAAARRPKTGMMVDSGLQAKAVAVVASRRCAESKHRDHITGLEPEQWPEDYCHLALRLCSVELFS